MQRLRSSKNTINTARYAEITLGYCEILCIEGLLEASAAEGVALAECDIVSPIGGSSCEQIAVEMVDLARRSYKFQ